MNAMKSVTAKSGVLRWLVAAGIGVCLVFPLSANADYRNQDAIEILAGAAVAYVLIDAVGGFDDKNRHRHGTRHMRYHDHHRDRYTDHDRYGKYHYRYKKRHHAKPAHGWRHKHHARKYRTRY